MPKQHPISYLNSEIHAMRWLSEQGLSPAEIREMRWGAADETIKKIRLRQEVFFLRYDAKTNAVMSDSYPKEMLIEVKDKEVFDFFFKSKIFCPWMFTAHMPKARSREGSREALFPLKDVEKYCEKNCSTDGVSVLTFLQEFATIGISKLNITNSKPEELIEEAEVV